MKVRSNWGSYHALKEGYFFKQWNNNKKKLNSSGIFVLKHNFSQRQALAYIFSVLDSVRTGDSLWQVLINLDNSKRYSKVL